MPAHPPSTIHRGRIPGTTWSGTTPATPTVLCVHRQGASNRPEWACLRGGALQRRMTRVTLSAWYWFGERAAPERPGPGAQDEVLSLPGLLTWQAAQGPSTAGPCPCGHVPRLINARREIPVSDLTHDRLPRMARLASRNCHVLRYSRGSASAAARQVQVRTNTAGRLSVGGDRLPLTDRVQVAPLEALHLDHYERPESSAEPRPGARAPGPTSLTRRAARLGGS